jgi:hypothetical protein
LCELGLSDAGYCSCDFSCVLRSDVRPGFQPGGGHKALFLRK